MIPAFQVIGTKKINNTLCIMWTKSSSTYAILYLLSSRHIIVIVKFQEISNESFIDQYGEIL